MKLFIFTLCIYALTLMSGCVQNSTHADEKYFFLTQAAAGTPVFYVGENGHDTASGIKEEEPLSTIKEAVKRLKPGTGGRATFKSCGYPGISTNLRQ